MSNSNTLVLNMTRFGDLLQCQPLFSGLKEQGSHTGLVHAAGLEKAVGLLADVDRAWPLDGGAVLVDERRWQRSLGHLAGWAADMRSVFPAQALVNLTPSLPMRMLARYLCLENPGPNAPAERGFHIDENGFSVNRDSWSLFLQASSSSRGCSPFNLVDLFCRVAGLQAGRRSNHLAGAGDEAKRGATQLLKQELSHVLPGLGLDRIRGYAGMQLGASQDRRRWPVARFAELSRMLVSEMGLCPVLLGTRAEQELAGRFFQCGGQGLDLVGRTSLEELAAVVGMLKVLVTNDTGTMHLAAGLGVPVAAVFLATAQPWDTGPYSDGAICLEPDMDCHPCAFGSDCPINHACRIQITVQAMHQAVLASLDPNRQPEQEAIRGSRVWRSLREENGLMGLDSLSGHDSQDRSRWIRLQRILYAAFLDGQDMESVSVPAIVPGSMMRDEALAVLEVSGQLLMLLEQQAGVLAVNPLEQMKKKFLATWQRIRAQWEGSPHFRVLSLLWAVQSQEAGTDMAMVRQMVVRYLSLIQAWKTALGA